MTELEQLQAELSQLNRQYIEADCETHRDVIAYDVVRIDKKIKELKEQLK